MKITAISGNLTQRRKHWIDQISESSTVAWPADNPVLSDIIADTWGWKQLQLAFFYEGHLVALLSASKINKVWMSLPHFDQGAIWVDENAIENAREQKMDKPGEVKSYYLFFIKKFLEVASSLNQKNSKVHIFELSLDDINPLADDGDLPLRFRCRSHIPVLKFYESQKVIPIRSLSSFSNNAIDAFSASVRRKIRKAERNGIEIEVGSSELVDQFYKVYQANIQQLGSFGLPIRFFRNLTENYKYGKAVVILAKFQNKVIGVAMLITFAGLAENIAFASLSKYNHLYVTYALHHAMIKLAVSEQCNIYSFGRSTRDSSGHHYKKQWGTEDLPLYYNDSHRGFKSIKANALAHNVLKMLPFCIRKPMDDLVSRIVY